MNNWIKYNKLKLKKKNIQTWIRFIHMIVKLLFVGEQLVSLF